MDLSKDHKTSGSLNSSSGSNSKGDRDLKGVVLIGKKMAKLELTTEDLSEAMVELSAKLEKIDSKLPSNNSIEELEKKVFEMGQIIENYEKLFAEMKKQNVELRKTMEKDKRDANLSFLELVENCQDSFSNLEKRILKLEHKNSIINTEFAKELDNVEGGIESREPGVEAVMPSIRSLNKHATEFQPRMMASKPSTEKPFEKNVQPPHWTYIEPDRNFNSCGLTPSGVEFEPESSMEKKSAKPQTCDLREETEAAECETRKEPDNKNLSFNALTGWGRLPSIAASSDPLELPTPQHQPGQQIMYQYHYAAASNLLPSESFRYPSDPSDPSDPRIPSDRPWQHFNPFPRN